MTTATATGSLAATIAEAHPLLMRHLAAAVPTCRVRNWPGVSLVSSGIPDAALNPIIVRYLLSADDLRLAVAAADELGVPAVVHVRHEALADAGPTLAGLGFRQSTRLPVMAALTPPPRTVPDHLVVMRVGAGTLEDCVRTMAEGLGSPAEVVGALCRPELLTHPDVALYLGWANGEPIATAASVQVHGGAGILSVTTLPAGRGHGYGRAMTAVAVADAFAAGASYAWLLATTDGASLYRRMGFAEVDEWAVFARALPAPRPPAD